MNELEIKQVPFMGSELTAARDADGQIWAGVRWLCDGIGLSEGQRKRQIANIQTDKVLSKGGSNLILPTKGGNQDVLCLKLDFVPLWLAKINITPTMTAETPELAERLEQYQLKAKDVLAAAFLPEKYESKVPSRRVTDAESAEKRATAMLLNAKNRTAAFLRDLYTQAGVKPEYQALALSDFYSVDGVALPRIALQGTKVTYDKGTIAKMLGIYSKASGGTKPHAWAIGLILPQLDIADDEREAVPYCRNGHDGTDYQYTESVIDKIRHWLEAHNWPTPICVDGKKCDVIYQK